MKFEAGNRHIDERQRVLFEILGASQTDGTIVEGRPVDVVIEELASQPPPVIHMTEDSYSSRLDHMPTGWVGNREIPSMGVVPGIQMLSDRVQRSLDVVLSHERNPSMPETENGSAQEVRAAIPQMIVDLGVLSSHVLG